MFEIVIFISLSTEIKFFMWAKLLAVGCVWLYELFIFWVSIQYHSLHFLGRCHTYMASLHLLSGHWTEVVLIIYNTFPFSQRMSVIHRKLKVKRDCSANCRIPACGPGSNAEDHPQNSSTIDIATLTIISWVFSSMAKSNQFTSVQSALHSVLELTPKLLT